MEPGAGAREQERRHAARAERLAAEHALTTDEARAALERAQRATHRWSAGAQGEVQVAHALRGLDRYGWTALHDVRWPGRRTTCAGQAGPRPTSTTSPSAPGE